MKKQSLAAALFVTVTVTLASPTVAAADTKQINITSGDTRAPVVELYTSEGCSSCPPADRWIRKLGATINQNFRAVPLAFHVDYWNYLGWTDPFSQAKFTQRQREVAAINRSRTIYTPEFVVDGREARRGGGIIKAIERANSEAAQADIVVGIRRRGDILLADIQVDNRAASARTYLAVYENAITRKIGGGENRGKTLTHDFVVRHWSAVGGGNASTAREIAIAPDWVGANLGLAVVVLDPATGATLQAVRTPLAKLFAG